MSKTARKEKDNLMSRLAEMTTKPNGAGSKQAEKALALAKTNTNNEPKPANTPSEIEQNKKTAQAKNEPQSKAVEKVTPKKSDKKTKPLSKNIKMGKAKTTSVSLHPQDEDRINIILEYLPRGRYSTSEIIKVALMGFTPQKDKVQDLLEAVRNQNIRSKGGI